MCIAITSWIFACRGSPFFKSSSARSTNGRAPGERTLSIRRSGFPGASERELPISIVTLSGAEVAARGGVVVARAKRRVGEHAPRLRSAAVNAPDRVLLLRMTPAMAVGMERLGKRVKSAPELVVARDLVDAEQLVIRDAIEDGEPLFERDPVHVSSARSPAAARSD